MITPTLSRRVSDRRTDRGRPRFRLSRSPCGVRPQPEPHVLAQAPADPSHPGASDQPCPPAAAVQQRPRPVAQQHRRHVKQQFVHQAGLEQRPAQGRPASTCTSLTPRPASSASTASRSRPVSVSGTAPHSTSAKRRPGSHEVPCSINVGARPSSRCAPSGVRQHTIQHHPQRRHERHIVQPHGQARIISQRRAAAGEDRRTACAPALHVRACRLAGYPLRAAIGQRRAPVKAHGQLDPQRGPPALDAAEKADY